MFIRVTSDANTESGVGEIVDQISGPLERAFVEKQYGPGLAGVVVVLMCRDPELAFVPRRRFLRKERKLYLDVMLNLVDMRHASSEFRKASVVNALLREVPAVVGHFKIESFDLSAFMNDLEGWFADQCGVTG